MCAILRLYTDYLLTPRFLLLLFVGGFFQTYLLPAPEWCSDRLLMMSAASFATHELMVWLQMACVRPSVRMHYQISIRLTDSWDLLSRYGSFSSIPIHPGYILRYRLVCR